MISSHRSREYDSQRAVLKPKQKPNLTSSSFTSFTNNKMPSSKGEPTDPELREKIKEEVKAEEKVP